MSSRQDILTILANVGNSDSNLMRRLELLAANNPNAVTKLAALREPNPQIFNTILQQYERQPAHRPSDGTAVDSENRDSQDRLDRGYGRSDTDFEFNRGPWADR